MVVYSKSTYIREELSVKNWQRLLSILLLSLFVNMDIQSVMAAAPNYNILLTITKESLYIGESVATELRFEPSADIKPLVTYVSDKPDIVAVDAKGTVTGLSTGDAIISAMIEGKKYSCKVIILSKPINMNLIPQDLNIYKKISDKLLFRTGVNTDLLYIAASVGSGFQNPPSYLGNKDKYGINQKVKVYFSPYRNAESAKEIYKTAISMNNPPKKFVGVILHDVLKYDDNVLLSKSYPAEEVFNHLEQFADNSKAANFFKDSQESYKKMLNDFAILTNFDYIERLSAFFGEQPKNAKYEVVLSTVMNGGQATFQRTEDGSTTYYNIMNPGQDYHNILLTLYHETAHSFYDVRQRQSDLVKEYSRYSNALGNYEYNFGDQMNETIIRAVTAVVMEQYHVNSMAESDLINFDKQGFKNVHNIYKLIKNRYLTNRNQYKTFDSFVPVIFDYVKASSSQEPFDIGTTR